MLRPGAHSACSIDCNCLLRPKRCSSDSIGDVGLRCVWRIFTNRSRSRSLIIAFILPSQKLMQSCENLGQNYLRPWDCILGLRIQWREVDQEPSTLNLYKAHLEIPCPRCKFPNTVSMREIRF